MNSNVVMVAKSPLASARATPVQFVISPRAILRRALHIAGKLDNRFNVRSNIGLNLNGAQHRRAFPRDLLSIQTHWQLLMLMRYSIMQQHAYDSLTVSFKCRQSSTQWCFVKNIFKTKMDTRGAVFFGTGARGRGAPWLRHC